MEVPGLGITHQQHTVGHAEMRAVQLEGAGLDPFLDEREGHQVLEALADHRVLEAGEVFGRARIAGLRLGGLDEGDPLADEVALRERLGLVGVGIFITAISTSFAVSRYLRLKIYDLYR